MNFLTKKIKNMRVSQDILQILSAPSRSIKEIKDIKINKIRFNSEVAYRNEKNTRYISILMIILSVLSFLEIMINNHISSKIYDLMFSFLSFLLFLCASFYNYKIKSFIKGDKNTISSFISFIVDKKNIFKCFIPLIAISFLFSQNASANPVKDFEKWFQNPSSNDTTAQIFQLVNAQSPFFNSIAIFASFIFATAIIGWCFYIIPLMLKASEDGSFSKNIFGSVGLVRLCLMACFLFPIPNSGSAGVLLAFETLKVSNNLANSVWNPYFDSTLTPPKDSTSTGVSEIDPDFKSVDLAKKILKAELCFNVLSLDNDKNSLNYLNVKEPSLKGENATNSVYWSYGNCGNFSYSTNEKPITIQNKWNSGNIDIKSALNAYNNSRISAMGDLISSIRHSQTLSTIDKYGMPPGLLKNTSLQPYPKNISLFLSVVAKKYDNAIKKASSQLNNTVNQAYYNKAKSDNEEYGWLLMFYHSSILSNAQSITNQMIQKTLVSSNLDTNQISVYSSDLKRSQGLLEEELKKESMKNSMMDGADLSDSANTSDSYWTQKLIAPLSHKMTETLGEMASTDPTDPLSTIRNEGQYLFDAFDVGFSGGVAGAVVLGNFASEKLGGASVLNFLSPYLFIILAGLWISAFIHAFVMPMTMTIMGTFILIAWLKTIVEFVICQPVLWFKYANMSGEKIIDRPHESGLDLLIGTLLFPTLTVLSFEAVNIVLPIVMNYINLTFVNSFIAQQGNSVSGLITDTAMILMLSSIQLASFVACMHIVRDVPSDVIKRFNGWIATAGDVQHNTGNVIANVESKSKETAGDIRHTLQNQNRSANTGKKVNPNQNNQNSEMLQQQKMPNKSVGKNESKNSEEKKTENNDDKDGTTQQSK